MGKQPTPKGFCAEIHQIYYSNFRRISQYIPQGLTESSPPQKARHKTGFFLWMRSAFLRLMPPQKKIQRMDGRYCRAIAQNKAVLLQG